MGLCSFVCAGCEGVQDRRAQRPGLYLWRYDLHTCSGYSDACDPYRGRGHCLCSDLSSGTDRGGAQLPADPYVYVIKCLPFSGKAGFYIKL